MGDVFECDRCKRIVGGRKNEFEIENRWKPSVRNRLHRRELCEDCFEEIKSRRDELENEFDYKWNALVEFAMNKPEPKKKWYQRRK